MPDKSSIRTEIELLSALEKGEIISQMRLSKRIAVSVGLVNALLKQAVRKGFVKTREAPAKRFAYYLTPKGFSEKSRLVAEYLETSLDFFRIARGQYEIAFQRLKQSGASDIALAGVGELAEIALLAANECGLEPKVIYDCQANLDNFHTIPVVRDITKLSDFDAIILTDSKHPQKIYDECTLKLDHNRVISPSFLRTHQNIEKKIEP